VLIIANNLQVKGPSAISLINSVAAGAACVAWSPKGKQLVAATRDGRLCQFMPDLRPARIAGPPEGLGPSPEAVAVVWLSSFQFGVVFRLGGADDQRLSKINLIFFYNLINHYILRLVHCKCSESWCSDSSRF